jgi:spore maturation protein CgeB
MFPGQVEWISTRPRSLSDYTRFRRDPAAWWGRVSRKIESRTCDAVLFVGWRKEFRALRPNEKYILYIVDDVRLAQGDGDVFGRVFLSDPGYEGELMSVLPVEKYGGVLPFAFYPPLHKPAVSRGLKRDICFIGNRDARRDPFLEALFRYRFRASIIGNYFMNSPLFWKRPWAFRRSVDNDAMGGIYARHKIGLNIHAQVVREGTNMRTFECAGYGIPQIVEYRAGIEKYFEPDKEILTFRNADEMVAQIRSLLDNPERAKTMAEAARLRASSEHTYYHRIARALAHLLPQHALPTEIRPIERTA